jgi:hypothetical protein
MNDVLGQFAIELVGLDQFQRAYEKIDSALDYDVTDRATFSATMQDIDGRIDTIAGLFPGNGMVENMARQMKAIYRREMLEQLEGVTA